MAREKKGFPLSQSSSQPTGCSSGAVKIDAKNGEPNLQKLIRDVQAFVQVALSNRLINVVVSPQLIRTTREVTISVEAGFSYKSKESDQTGPHIKNTINGLHILSKSKDVDEILKELKITHISSAKYNEIGVQQATLTLNAGIASDTEGTIAGFMEANNLDDPKLTLQLVTCLFQQVTWNEPLDAMSQKESLKMTWNTTTHPEIKWIKSHRTNTITHVENKHYQFVAVPLTVKGMKAVLVLPPEETNPDSEDLNQVLSDGLTSIYSKNEIMEAKLKLPKFSVDYQFTTKYPEAGANSTHRVLFTVDEKGAKSGSLTRKWGFDFSIPPKQYPEFCFNRLFYIAIIDGQNAKEPRIICMARINQPQEDVRE